jgi:hypothetical protein
MKVKAGDVINFETTGTGTVSGRIVITATSIDETTTVATKADFFSTDTNTLTHKTSAIVATDPVGTFNTYSYAINSNTRTICGTAPTQTVTNMKTNGFLIYTRAYNAASTCANPARVEIKIAPAGTSLPTLSKELYKSAGKSISGNTQLFDASTLSSNGFFHNGIYDQSTGVIVFDSAFRVTTITNAIFAFSDGTTTTSGYLVINAQKAKTTAVADFKEFDYVYVRATSNNGQAISSSIATLLYEDESSDTTNSYDPSTGQFICPNSGLYQVDASMSAATASTDVGIVIRINGSDFALSRSRENVNSNMAIISGTLALEKGDIVTIGGFSATTSNKTTVSSANYLTITRIPGQFR